MSWTPEEEKAYMRAYHSAHKETHNSRMRVYYAEHREKLKAHATVYRASHLEEERVNNKAYRAAHKKHYRTYLKSYRADHLEKELAYSKTYRAEHGEEMNRKRRGYRAEHGEAVRTMEKKYNAIHRKEKNAQKRFQTYGLSQSAFDTMLTNQGHVCAICGKAPWNGRNPHVDHDHKTGKIRGILCNRCNVGVGMVLDDPKIARAMADYLESHS